MCKIYFFYQNAKRFGRLWGLNLVVKNSHFNEKWASKNSEVLENQTVNLLKKVKPQEKKMQNSIFQHFSLGYDVNNNILKIRLNQSTESLIFLI